MFTFEDPMTATKRVLIVDDNAVNRRLAELLFLRRGWQVATVVSGEQALLDLVVHRYDLVLLDISMPGITGVEVCQHIRADQELRTVRVIAYTAHALREEQERFLASGFDAVLVKPISPRALQEVLLAQPLNP
jgi:two-component system cell cycle response regulator DivK